MTRQRDDLALADDAVAEWARRVVPAGGGRLRRIEEVIARTASV